MTVLQERQISQQATASTLSLAFSSSLTAGSVVHDGGSAGITTTTTYVFSDGVNSYVTLGQTDDPGNGQSMGHGYAHNVAAGATTETVTFGTNIGFIGLWIREIGGVLTNPLDGHNENKSSGTTVSATATNTVQPAFWSAFGQNDSVAGAPTASTGTQDITGWDFGLGFGDFGTSSHNHVTTTAAQSATFTAAGAAGILAVMAMFDESGGGVTSQPRLTLLGVGS